MLTRFSNNTVYFGTLTCPFSSKSLICLHGCFSKASENFVSRGPPVLCVRAILKFIHFLVSDERLLWSVESRHGWNQFLPLSAAACQKYNQKECRTRCGPTSEQKSLLIHLLDRARSIVSAKQTIRYKLPLALEPSPNRWPEQNIAGYKSP